MEAQAEVCGSHVVEARVGLLRQESCRHETLWTVLDRGSDGVEAIRRWRDPVEAQRDADGMNRSAGHTATVVPPIRP